MTPVLNEETGVMYETIDVNIIPDLYVTWIVDIWKGDQRDPAVEVNRFIGVWHADSLEDEDGNAVDPTFVPGRWGDGIVPSIKPLHWELLDHVKKADSAALSFKRQQDQAMNTEGYYGRNNQPFVDFMTAIETLVDDPENEAAWQAVDAFRKKQAMEHER